MDDHAEIDTDNAADITQYMLARSANVNVRDLNGFTPLHYAAQQGCGDVVLTLVQAGADVDAETQDGVTPIYLATYFNKPHVIDILLRAGATASVPVNSNSSQFNNVQPLVTA